MGNVTREASVVVRADAGRVWSMVTDVTRMGEWSPETEGAEWIDGATGPAVGARFKGHNRKGRTRWSTTCEVIESQPGQGSAVHLRVPLTLAILPVLIVRLGTQPFAVPLSMVREIIPIQGREVQQVSGRATLVVRDEVLPVKTLASLIGWPDSASPAFGVLMQSAESAFVLAIDAFVGRDDVVIKPLSDVKPHGVAGATLSGDGQVVLVLDMEALLSGETPSPHASLFKAAAAG